MGAQITLRERYAISLLKQRGHSIREIARELSRSPSSISRELARNHTNHDGFYRPEKADSGQVLRFKLEVSRLTETL